MLPCVLFEDEHLLVVNKPAGMNTHAPSPYAGEGIYDWLRNREPRWANLAIIHRLDKETSGVIVFGKTPIANRSLTEQFTERAVAKSYLLLTDRELKEKEFVARSNIRRVGDAYASGATGEPAETRFRCLNQPVPVAGCKWVEALPFTGRTHQIRVHAAEHGFPILGDSLYGGTKFDRVCLHAAEIIFRHPSDGKEMRFKAPVDFAADARLILRTALVDATETNAFRLVHGASDGHPGWYVERFGDFCLSQDEQPLTAEQRTRLAAKAAPARGVYHKLLSRKIRGVAPAEASPQLILGDPAPEKFIIRENGVDFETSFREGYSVGLFLDQRDNRRRFLTGYVAPGFSLQPKVQDQESKIEVLNCFAYTCGFSVCAAQAGAVTTSLDLSKKYLEWGKRNFALNGLDPAAHDFIYGDTFDWLRRFAKKRRAFDIIVLDPPTFSQSKESGVFRVEKDFERLTTAALAVLKPGGVLLASTNAADWEPEKFLEAVESGARMAKRKIVQRHYSPQPPDFPVSRQEPAYLKTVWMRMD